MKWLALLVIPGGTVIAVVLGLHWLIRRQRQRAVDPELQALIDQKGVRVMEVLPHKEGEARREIAARRRDHADEKRRQASQIESGADSPEKMRLVVSR